MHYITPEKAGISSKNVLAFYKELEAQHLSTHSLILSRGDGIFSECYWAPFHKDFKHRMLQSPLSPLQWDFVSKTVSSRWTTPLRNTFPSTVLSTMPQRFGKCSA